MGLALAGGAAFGALGDLVASFPNHPRGSGVTHYGLAADGVYLYSVRYINSRYIYRMLRTTGSLVSSYPNPLLQIPGGEERNYVRGLSYGGGPYLYIANYSTRSVGCFYASNGSLLSTWLWPSSPGRIGICCTHDGTNPGNYLWLNSGGYFYRTTTTGSIVTTFEIAPPANRDLAWDYVNGLMWYGDNAFEYVCGITTTGSFVASWVLPPKVKNPFGVAYYGNYLYVSTSYGTPDEYIWVYHCPNINTISPTSLGRVKALFK